MEKDADAFAIVDSTDGLREDVADFENFELGTAFTVLSLVDGVGDDDFVEGTGIDALNGITTEDTMRDEGIDFGRSFLLEQLGRTCDGVTRIREIVDQNCSLACDVSDKHHRSVLSIRDLCWPPLFVDEGELDAQCIGDSCSSFRTACIGTYDDAVSKVWDVVLDVLLKQWASVQIVDGNIEKALVLRIVQIHRDDVISSSAGEKISHKGTCLCDPLLVARSRLEGILR